jgi:L-aminopeptidase/D-esterase-like protein
VTARRASLPGADELFRPTHTPQSHHTAPPGRHSADRQGTGRQKHDSKITVYISDEELLALEHTRLAVRATFGVAVDRGRIVREAVAVLLADFEQYGPNSQLIRRLLGESDE